MSIPLRPHHALCLRFFIGEGYSEGFVRHMYEVKARLAPDTCVTLTDGCDIVCEACPHRIGNVCETAQKVAAIDRRVMDAAGLCFGDAVCFSELSARAGEKILCAGKLRAVCRGCQWLYICENQEG